VDVATAPHRAPERPVEKPIAAQRKPEPSSAAPSAPQPPGSPSAAQPSGIAVVAPPAASSPKNSPRILRATPPVASPAAPPPAAAAPDKLAALPPPKETPGAVPAVPDRPQIAVIRGGRQPASARREPEPRRLASLPPATAPGAGIATDASPIIVLRGVRGPRYALAGRVEPPQPAEPPLLAVIRGARPRPTGIEGFVQPSALVLRIPD